MKISIFLLSLLLYISSINIIINIYVRIYRDYGNKKCNFIIFIKISIMGIYILKLNYYSNKKCSMCEEIDSLKWGGRVLVAISN